MSRTELARLYDAHAPALFRFAMALTGTEADTRDVLQEVFLRLAKRPAEEVIHDPAAWLYRATRNLVTDHARRRAVKQRALERMASETSNGPTTFSEADAEGLSPALAAQALASLPGEQRAVVHLKIWEEMTFARIAEVLEISPNTAASRYRYAMQNLRAALPLTVPDV
jgi:RNA polymerase sigma-70 factor (ECF subfamily)